AAGRTRGISNNELGGRGRTDRVMTAIVPGVCIFPIASFIRPLLGCAFLHRPDSLCDLFNRAALTWIGERNYDPQLIAQVVRTGSEVRTVPLRDPSVAVQDLPDVVGVRDCCSLVYDSGDDERVFYGIAVGETHKCNNIVFWLWINDRGG